MDLYIGGFKMSDSTNWLQRSLLATLALFLMAVGGLAEPGSGKIQGQVTDTSGASHAIQTDEEGRYAFSPLAPGTYTIRIQLKGFADFEKAGVVVARGQTQ